MTCWPLQYWPTGHGAAGPVVDGAAWPAVDGPPADAAAAAAAEVAGAAEDAAAGGVAAEDVDGGGVAAAAAAAGSQAALHKYNWRVWALASLGARPSAWVHRGGYIDLAGMAFTRALLPGAHVNGDRGMSLSLCAILKECAVSISARDSWGIWGRALVLRSIGLTAGPRVVSGDEPAPWGREGQRHGLSYKKMALITSDCGAMRLPAHQTALIASQSPSRRSGGGRSSGTGRSGRSKSTSITVSRGLQLQSPWILPAAAVS